MSFHGSRNFGTRLIAAAVILQYLFAGTNVQADYKSEKAHLNEQLKEVNDETKKLKNELAVNDKQIALLSSPTKVVPGYAGSCVTNCSTVYGSSCTDVDFKKLGFTNDEWKIADVPGAKEGCRLLYDKDPEMAQVSTSCAVDMEKCGYVKKKLEIKKLQNRKTDITAALEQLRKDNKFYTGQLSKLRTDCVECEVAAEYASVMKPRDKKLGDYISDAIPYIAQLGLGGMSLGLGIHGQNQYSRNYAHYLQQCKTAGVPCGQASYMMGMGMMGMGGMMPMGMGMGGMMPMGMGMGGMMPMGMGMGGMMPMGMGMGGMMPMGMGMGGMMPMGMGLGIGIGMMPMGMGMGAPMGMGMMPMGMGAPMGMGMMPMGMGLGIGAGMMPMGMGMGTPMGMGMMPMGMGLGIGAGMMPMGMGMGAPIGMGMMPMGMGMGAPMAMGGLPGTSFNPWSGAVPSMGWGMPGASYNPAMATNGFFPYGGAGSYMNPVAGMGYGNPQYQALQGSGWMNSRYAIQNQQNLSGAQAAFYEAQGRLAVSSGYGGGYPSMMMPLGGGGYPFY